MRQIWTIFAVAGSLALAAAAATSSYAANLQVPSGFPTVQAAVNAAVDGDSVILAFLPFNENVTVANKSITISGSGQKPNVLGINTSGSGTVTLNNLIIGGPGPGFSDTVVNVRGNTLTMTNCEVRSRLDARDGGALNITSSTFLGSPETEAVVVRNTPLVRLDRSLFVGGDGFAGQCGGNLLVNPKPGKPALSFTNCPNIVVSNCIVEGGTSGVLDGIAGCGFALPIGAPGGSAISLARGSDLTLQNSTVRKGEGSPEGRYINADITSAFSDEGPARSTAWMVE